MGVCVYCGIEAGLFSTRHSLCRERVNAGSSALRRLTEDAFAKGTTGSLKPEIQKIADRFFLSQTTVSAELTGSFRAVVDHLGAERMIDGSDMRLCGNVASALGLPPSTVHDAGVGRLLERANTLRALLQGRYPEKVETHGIVLHKLERPVWCFEHVVYHADTVRRWSVRKSNWISGGGLFGTRAGSGQSLSQTFEKIERKRIDTGVVLITDHSLYFKGEQHAFRIAFKNVVSREALSDGGMDLMQNTSRARWQVFDVGSTAALFLEKLVVHLTDLRLKQTAL